MAGTRNTLASMESNLLESMGNRADASLSRPVVTPHPRDIGRLPLPGFGTLAVDQLIPDPAQPRTDFSPEALGRLADSIREQGQLAPIRVRWSDELGKWAIKGSLTHEQAARLVRQRRGRRRDKPRHTKLCFPTEAGWKVVVSAQRKGTYHEIEQALEDALTEVRHRIRNDVQLF